MGLREQKKRETRQAISDLATRLFIERGFEAVTIAEVAAAAKVAKMTVTNHFPRKEDLVLDIHAELASSLANTVRARARGVTAWAALRTAYLAAIPRHDPLLGFAEPAFIWMINDSPTLLARLRELHEAREHALAATLAAEETAADDFLVRAVAGQLASAHRVLFEDAFRAIQAGVSHEELAERLLVTGRAVFELLRPSIGDFAPRK
ncbi:TetR/AcrR family transcriptional regulator [Crossiella sp. CA-258035]|uniref:TetR/AcrR family transcriptional regulator n=1 Tax=Crossiella sp. CA-258035 TaxID=2981138 RepID=UPI0024BCC277|nr:TetR/AcrR family transcriptional regulator [Crossiella sp. CA-258035]WHT22082.1 TetR/AcrR family transcriptional regulator [Crossiella sp. CA-258035]